MSLCAGKPLSVTLRHNEQGGKTLPYMGKLTQLCILISLHSGLALYDALPIYGDHLPRAMRSLLKEQTFFGRKKKSQECHRSGVDNSRAAAFLAGDSGGHILGSFRSYFIHNGLGRAEILESEQIFGKSFVHRSREEASWENPQDLMSYKSAFFSSFFSFL